MHIHQLPPRNIKAIIAAIILALYILVNGIYYLDASQVRGDAEQYVRMAYNLSEYGVLSLDTAAEVEQREPQPTSYREPGFPTYLALYRLVIPQLRQANLNTLLSPGKIIELFKYSQLIVLLATAFLAAYVIFKLTNKLLWSYLAIFIIGFSQSLLDTANILYAENFVALLVVAVSLMLYSLFKEKKLIYFLGLGISLGLLVLSRAIFWYFIIFIIALFAYAFMKQLFKQKTFLIGLILFFFSYTSLTGAYMIRNSIHFGEANISGRGGIVLLIRANKNMMNLNEFLGSFLVWTPEPFTSKLINNFYGSNALEKGGKLERLSRIRGSKSFYRTARAQRSELKKIYGVIRDNKAVNDRLMAQAKQKILANPLRHILVTFPVAWRGIFIEKGLKITIPFIFQVYGPTVISLLYFLSLFYVAIFSLIKKYLALFSLTLPAIFMYGMHSLISHNLPRFNLPLLPMTVITFLITLYMFIYPKQSLSLLEESKLDRSKI